MTSIAQIQPEKSIIKRQMTFTTNDCVWFDLTKKLEVDFTAKIDNEF